MAHRKHKIRLTKDQVEALSKRNANAIVEGTSKLKSWGRSGWYKCKTNGTWLPFRSNLERNVYLKLDELKVIDQIGAEALIIQYDFKGAKLNYVPDIVVKVTSGRTYIIEVKPDAQLHEEKNVAKWKTAREWCFARGVKFLVVTEKTTDDIGNMLNE